MALDSSIAPSGNFDLSNWKITLPVDSNDRFSGTAMEVKNLSGYQHSKHLYTAADDAMTFVAPVEGATTSGSSYARSELREMNGTAKPVWNLQTGGFMSAILEVDAAPNREGMGGKIVVGQITARTTGWFVSTGRTASSASPMIRLVPTTARRRSAS
jgi:hypothetical protein